MLLKVTLFIALTLSIIVPMVATLLVKRAEAALKNH